jgi:hypothetical protein
MRMRGNEQSEPRHGTIVLAKHEAWQHTECTARFGLARIQTYSLGYNSPGRLDDDLQRMRIGGLAEGLVGVHDVVQAKVVRMSLLGSSRPERTVLSSIGVLTVSTRRVVIVMFRSQSRFEMQVGLQIPIDRSETEKDRSPERGTTAGAVEAKH